MLEEVIGFFLNNSSRASSINFDAGFLKIAENNLNWLSISYDKQIVLFCFSILYNLILYLHNSVFTDSCLVNFCLDEGLTGAYMDEEAKKRFAEAVKALRGNRDREEFAKIVGVSRPTIIGWENCKVVPKRESLEIVAEMRGESLDEFLSFLNGAKRRDPMERLLNQISGLSDEQISLVLQAIADRFKKD
ncbi:helix-turn-helix transcriptional regulator [Microseira sp. BLCC-F43]|uniref:helix-turn-helix transcriptional regulator n=1 Tax=Microseira sp. BLCC-F43 TaxID=3153602 RepID=UPI0035B6C76F